MAATTTTPTTEEVPTRTRFQVADDLVSAVQACESAKAEDRKSLRRIVVALEGELMAAPLQPVHEGKGIVDLDGVLSYLRGHRSKSFSSEELAVVTGHDPTAAVKARITNWARHTPDVVQEGRPGRYLYRAA